VPVDENVHAANVPVPPTTSTLTTRLVPENEVMMPSIKLVGVAVLATRIRSEAVNAVAVDARLVVNDFEPVPTATDVVLVNPE
jgi:hypothetical protein